MPVVIIISDGVSAVIIIMPVVIIIMGGIVPVIILVIMTVIVISTLLSCYHAGLLPLVRVVVRYRSAAPKLLALGVIIIIVLIN